MSNKRSKQQPKPLPTCKCSGDCWCNILSFLSAKEHCRVLRTCKVISAAGRTKRSWSPTVEAPSLVDAVRLQTQGCTAPPRELRLGFTPAACAWKPHPAECPVLKDWMTAKLETLHFEIDTDTTSLTLLTTEILPSIRRLSIAATRVEMYPTVGGIFQLPILDETEQAHYADTLQALVLSRFEFVGPALDFVKWRNLTVLRLEECTHPRQSLRPLWDLLHRLHLQLIELGTPKFVREPDDKGTSDLFMSLPICTLPNLIRLWGHAGRHEDPQECAELLDKYMPNLQRLYVIPPSVKETKRLADGIPYDPAFFDVTVSCCVRSCGLIKCDNYPSDFNIDEAVHRKLGNWGKHSVTIVYTTTPRACGQFDK